MKNDEGQSVVNYSFAIIVLYDCHREDPLQRLKGHMNLFWTEASFYLRHLMCYVGPGF